MNNFAKAFAWMGPHEWNAYRHYTNLAADPGGATNWGVTQRLMDGVRNRIPGLPLNVRDLTLAQAQTIYQFVFWPPFASIANDQIATKLFDMGVNLGVGTAITYVQQAIGGLAVDGHIGPITISAINKYQDIPGLLKKLCDHLSEHYNSWCDAEADREQFRAGLLDRAQQLPQAV